MDAADEEREANREGDRERIGREGKKRKGTNETESNFYGSQSWCFAVYRAKTSELVCFKAYYALLVSGAVPELETFCVA